MTSGCCFTPIIYNKYHTNSNRLNADVAIMPGNAFCPFLLQLTKHAGTDSHSKDHYKRPYTCILHFWQSTL